MGPKWKWFTEMKMDKYSEIHKIENAINELERKREAIKLKNEKKNIKKLNEKKKKIYYQKI